MDTAKAPDRLRTSEKAKELIDQLDEMNFMGLGKASITRSELFLFAMALGIEADLATPLKSTYQGGLILDKSVDSKTRAMIYSQFIARLSDPDNELDNIMDKGAVYSMAEQLANTGFEIIEDYLKTKKPFDLVLDMLIELDEQYNVIFN